MWGKLQKKILNFDILWGWWESPHARTAAHSPLPPLAPEKEMRVAAYAQHKQGCATRWAALLL